MVIGNGLVAKAFSAYNNDDNFLVFASGVSNSANKEEKLFARERALLEKTLKEHTGKHFVYFSTCSLYDPSLKNSLYVNHKLAMETLIKEEHPDYHIFRISNLAGNTTNSNTLLNFFYQHIVSGEFFHIWQNAARNIIDIDDAVILCDYIIQNELLKNRITNIANPHNYSVLSIIEIFEQMLHKKGNYDIIEKSSIPFIDTTTISFFIDTLKINFEEDYLLRTLHKYYS